MKIVASIARRGVVVLTALSLIASVVVQPAMAEHVIPILGTQPVLGRMTSTADLQAHVVRQRADFETASQAIGLTESQTSELERRIANKQLRYVLIPRHLEAMTGKEGGRIFLERDVVIPANTYGWAIDIPDGSQIITVYLPAACGNLSLVHRSAPPPPPRPRCPQNMRGTPPNCYVPTCPQGMLGTPPNCYPPPTPVPAPEVTPPPPVEKHRTSWLLFPLIFVGGYVIGHSNTPPPPPPCDP